MEYFEKDLTFLLLTVDITLMFYLIFEILIKLILLIEIFIDTPSFGESSDHIYIYISIDI